MVDEVNITMLFSYTKRLSSREPCKHCYYFCFTKQLMTLFICMYVHCIGYRQRSVSVVMALEPRSKSSLSQVVFRVFALQNGL